MEQERQRIDVFLSSTSKDLAIHRAAVRDVLIRHKMHPIMMEDFPSVSRDSVDTCMARVDEAQLFIGVYANRYGYRPNNGDFSITELEYDEAEKKGLDRLIFVLDPTASFPADHPIRTFADNDPRLKTFLDRVGKKLVWNTFTSPEDLALKVTNALDSWEKRPALTPSGPVVPSILGMVLLLLTLLILGETFWRLIRAGDQSLSVLGTVLAVGGGLLSLALFSVKNTPRILDQLLHQLPIPAWGIRLILQFVVLVVALLIGSLLPNVLAQQQLTNALHASTVDEAQKALDTATILGATVSDPLRQALLDSLNLPSNDDNDARAVRLATLYAKASGLGRQAIVSDFATQADEAAAKSQASTADRLVKVLIALSPDAAVKLAGDFNDKGVSAETDNHLAEARTYLEAVRLIDNTLEGGRDNRTKSISRFNLAQVQELSNDDKNNLKVALQTYRESIRLDDGNVSSRYALSSLLLSQFSDDPASLDEAVQVAAAGWQNYLDLSPSYCRGKQNLADNSILEKTWDCFGLLTTEAGSRLKRHNLDKGDTNSKIETLTRQATDLAIANDQFHAQSGYYTGEAYYYLAQITAPNTDLDTLCRIAHNVDPNGYARQRPWLDYANAQIAGRECPVGS